MYLQTVGEKPAFTDEELEEYIRQYHAEAAGKPVSQSFLLQSVKGIIS